MNKNDAIKIAKEYHQSCNLDGTVTDEATFYEDFIDVEGSAYPHLPPVRNEELEKYLEENE